MTRRTMLVLAGLAIVLGSAGVVLRWTRSAVHPSESAAENARAPVSQPRAASQPVGPANAPPHTAAAPNSAQASATSPSEAALMTRLRKLAKTEPAAAIALAREGSRRFADSAQAPERTAILIHALAQQGRAAEARGEAETMVNHYPDSSWVRDVEQFTGAHRHRNLRVGSSGKLEYR